MGTLSIVTDITKMAQYWFEISERIREDLNRTIHDPVFLMSFNEHHLSKSAGDEMKLKEPDLTKKLGEGAKTEDLNDVLPGDPSWLQSRHKRIYQETTSRPRPTTTHWLFVYHFKSPLFKLICLP